MITIMYRVKKNLAYVIVQYLAYHVTICEKIGAILI